MHFIRGCDGGYRYCTCRSIVGLELEYYIQYMDAEEREIDEGRSHKLTVARRCQPSTVEKSLTLVPGSWESPVAMQPLCIFSDRFFFAFLPDMSFSGPRLQPNSDGRK